MAYLTSSAAVSNVFTIGNVKLHMYETKVTPDGKPAETVADGAMKSADTNSYHLQPGVTYLKDPTVYVDASSDRSYLFIRLRNDLKTIEKQDDPLYPTILQQLQKNGWLEIQRDANNVDAVFVYVGEYNGSKDLTDEIATATTAAGTLPTTPAERTAAILAQLKDIPAHIVGGKGTREDIDVFHNFTLADEIEGLERFGGARVAIVAYAVQASGVGGTAAEGSYEAYKKAWDYVKAELPFVN
jgi:hypothetical protein